MNAARIGAGQEPEPRQNISSVVTGLAGVNRSGKQRLLPEPEQAGDSEATNLSAGRLPGQTDAGGRETADPSEDQSASRDLSVTIADTQVAQEVAGGGQSHPLNRGEVHHSLVNSDEEQTPFEMGDEGEMAAAKAAADLAETQAGGSEDDVIVIDPSPTNFNPDKMPKTIASNMYTCASISNFVISLSKTGTLKLPMSVH